MIGAHTDSPCLRVKPISDVSKHGLIQVGVETYGGGQWHTWFDRDLGMAGRVTIRQEDGQLVQKLIRIDKPIMRIPTLAVHMDRNPGFSPNHETHLVPIAGMATKMLNGDGQSSLNEISPEGRERLEDQPKAFQPFGALDERHHPRVLKTIAEAAEVSPEQLIDFELVLFDTQKPCLGGLDDEFIYAARLDNLNMVYSSIMGLISSLSLPSSSNLFESTIRLVCCFDHEEVGSLTAVGANSDLLPSVLRRLSQTRFHEKSYDDSDLASAYDRTIAKSFLISADMAHAFHPNYPEFYESRHRPQMNNGVVIKVNAKARYTTNHPGIVLMEEVARRANSPSEAGSLGVPLQFFIIRNDKTSGGTIGPMLSAKLGLRALDLGNPQLSMHSIRECAGVRDLEFATQLFQSFFTHYADLGPKYLAD
ncbi:hypothetical protein BP6252_11272 [Coleophoma cylindrospora]|uniref:aspartyl aminopeptidase n=1 Tax=Coleophoma cylindrospora TaxID=1849047 RepID=A0A3D8QPL3_9HELO|nr:hypothetical protein BP6252_11272 [Coleophoma cylindrospora]